MATRELSPPVPRLLLLRRLPCKVFIAFRMFPLPANSGFLAPFNYPALAFSTAVAFDPCRAA